MMDAPLKIDIEYGGELGGSILVTVKNNGSALFPAPNKLTIGSGVHLIIRDPETNQEKLLYWGESPFGGGTDTLINGLAAGEVLEAQVSLTGENARFELRGDSALQPNKAYELSVGYGYIKGAQPSAGFISPRDRNADYPMQRLVGLKLTTDKDLNFEIVATSHTRTEFVPETSSANATSTNETLGIVPAKTNIRSKNSNSTVREPQPMTTPDVPGNFFWEVGLLALLTLCALGFNFRRKKTSVQ